MAHFISDRLDYNNTDTFLTPFGGMCRVLLNKPRHRQECYNDFSSGLNALMSVLSDHDRAIEFIHRLYYNTEYSQEEFDRQKKIFDNAETDLEEQEKEKLRRLLIDNEIISAVSARGFLDAFMEQAQSDSGDAVKEHNDVIKAAFVKLDERFKKDTDFEKKFQEIFDNWFELYQLKERQGYIERSSDMGEYVSEMDLAVATYIVYLQSRDGRGEVWSGVKFASQTQYLNRILTLYDCAERLKGVHVYQIDAIDFFREFAFHDIDLKDEDVDPNYLMLNKWINNPRVMMYCDPSYISPDDEKRLLGGINVNQVNNLSNAIKEKYNGKKMPKNLGEIYARSFGYPEQENFLRCIQNARCKIMVSNYDLTLYNKYLNSSTGWRREEFRTTTSVGGKKGNERIEVIWYNY